VARFVLYRILGNDLPPRHRPGQTLSNLEFMLRNEPALQDCEKRWVVNRIVDPAVEDGVLALLRKRGLPYLHIPFVEAEYGACGMDFEGLPESRYIHHEDFRALSLPWKLRVMEWCYRSRTLYLTNNNGARNAAIEEGRKLADWTLPFDGNCFFTAAAWEEFRKAAAGAGDRRYLIVPMARVRDNRELLDASFQPGTMQEPQIAFRRDAAERFDPRLRYGTMDKSALLYRLEVPGIWQTFGPKFPPWERLDLSPSPEKGKFLEAGWVARLFSGQERLEEQAGARDVVRMQSILRICNRVDARILRRDFSRRQLCYFPQAELEALRGAARGGDHGRRAVAESLKQRANDALQAEPLSLGGWNSFTAGVTALALHGYVCGDSLYTRRAADWARAWLLDPASRRGPGTDDTAGARDDPRTGASILQFRGLVYVLDALRLIRRSGALLPTEGRALQQWFRDFLRWLKTDDHARRASWQLNHVGTARDLVAVAVALYANDVGFARQCLDAARMRIAMQIRPDGSQVHEPERPDQLLNLELWSELARLAPAVKLDLGSFRTGDDRGLAAAAAALDRDPALSAEDRTRLDSVLALLGPGDGGTVSAFLRAAGGAGA
jgi:hypothetical protein